MQAKCGQRRSIAVPQNAKHAALFMQRVVIDAEIVIAGMVHGALHANAALNRRLKRFQQKWTPLLWFENAPIK
jgi:hypothetical protein